MQSFFLHIGTVCVCMFSQKKISKKAVHSMLVKLSTGVEERTNKLNPPQKSTKEELGERKKAQPIIV